MTYLSGKAKKRKQIIRYGIYAALFFLLVIFWVTIRSIVYPVIEPAVVQYGSFKKGITSFPSAFMRYTASNKELLEKNKQLETEVERLENLLAEKTAEEEMLDASSSQSLKLNNSTLVMYPLLQDKTKMYSTILLSKGFKDGVEVGEDVYVRGLQVVCTIKEVYTSTSLCLLLSASGETTEAVTASSSITLSLVGRGGSFVADVARDTPVSVGEKVLLRSNQQLTVGTVVSVLNNNQDTSWHVFVVGAYNPVTSSLFYAKKK